MIADAVALLGITKKKGLRPEQAKKREDANSPKEQGSEAAVTVCT